MNAKPLSRVFAIDALKYICNSFNTPPNLSHSQDVAWMVVHNLNNVCKFGDIPLLQAFKDCAVVERRLSFRIFFQLSFHQKSSSDILKLYLLYSHLFLQLPIESNLFFIPQIKGGMTMGNTLSGGKTQMMIKTQNWLSNFVWKLFLAWLSQCQ